MINSDQYKNAWNNRVSYATAHLDLAYFMDEKGYNHLVNIYDNFVCNKIDFNKDDIILDYGCGGGWLGWRIFDKKIAIKKYIGLDVSARSIKFASIVLNNNKKVKLVEIDPYNYSIKKYSPTIVTSLSVIQHMPNIEMIKNFLEKINNSGARVLVLQIRKGDKNWFAVKPYNTTHDINIANTLTIDFIKNELTNYNICDSYGIKDYCYLRFNIA